MSRTIHFALIVLLGFTFFIGILNFLPVGSDLPEGLTAGIILVFGYMQLFNFLFPIDQLFFALTAALAFQAAVFIWHIIRWTIALVSKFVL